MEDIADCRTARRRHNADFSREQGNRSFSRGVKQSLRLQAGLELLKGELESPDPFGFHVFHINLIIPSGFVDGQLAKDRDRQSILRPELQRAIAPPEHDRPELSPVVLEGKVHVSRGVELEVGDFALNPHPGKGILDEDLELGGKLTDAVDARLCEVHGPYLTYPPSLVKPFPGVVGCITFPLKSRGLGDIA